VLNLELVLSKLYKDGHIEEEIRSSRVHTNKPKNIIGFLLMVIYFKKRRLFIGQPITNYTATTIELEEQVKDADGVQPIKDITPTETINEYNQ
jgi:hypothetical protein